INQMIYKGVRIMKPSSKVCDVSNEMFMATIGNRTYAGEERYLSMIWIAEMIGTPISYFDYKEGYWELPETGVVIYDSEKNFTEAEALEKTLEIIFDKHIRNNLGFNVKRISHISSREFQYDEDYYGEGYIKKE
ncbi:MAG: hypothetical protein PUP93_09530, partial [Rhizonema sp. NSF051]|nr:hypothetical protein [Rhizonema sp. NSF051]